MSGQAAGTPVAGSRDGAADARRGMWTAPLLSLALALGSVLVSLLAIEVGLRATLPAGTVRELPRAFADEDTQGFLRWLRRHADPDQPDPYVFDVPDPLLGWKIRPGVVARSSKPGSYDVTIRTNAAGLRGAAPVETEKPAGRVRIGIFGCSQTFGEGVEDDAVYAARLGRTLPRAEVLNFGVHGYGTDQMLLYYENAGRPYDLDVVVLAFGWFHMLRNVRSFGFFAKPRFEPAADGTLQVTHVPVPDPDTLRRTPPGGAWLRDRSVLLRWAWQRILNRREAAAYRPDGEAWRVSRALVARFVEEARRDGAAVVLLNIDEAHPDLDPLMAGLAQDLQVGFLDLGELMRRQDPGGHQYRIAGDGHWNAAGHAVVAAALREYLCRTEPTLRSACAVPDSPLRE